ncbi:hypothetical protein SAMN05445756_1698 [Kytococcus aerolatus]|uniref:TadE-like protein n=1 Tax=Kytococcus aerolatus TaxID=592308 RepID=A0A212U1C2_9MICO|nr:hypothetical protein [Kytococcus aerolatus]SNC72028.1 hypothetical protein SAMN05445756_1698 [Kytococcus aerolatus]
MSPAERRDDRGSAMIEYVVVVGAVVAPLVYLIVLLADVQAAAFASTSAAREAGRVAVAEQSTGDGAPEPAGQAAADLVLQDFGIEHGTTQVLCTGCDAPEGQVTAITTVEVPLPGLARLGVTGPSVVTLTAEHTEPLDLHRELP